MTSQPVHPADTFDTLRVAGAREHNLNNVTVEIPKRRLTVCTGVSGSGKSSLIFGTIAAESQRLVNETYSTFVQGFMPPTTRPQVDRLAGLTTTIAIDQESLPANPRSTVGTVTDVHALLRILFSRVGVPHIGGPQAFAFNVASVQASGRITVQKGDAPVSKHQDFSLNGGMCPRCEGRGSVSDFALEELYDADKSLADGALKVPGYSMDGWYGRLFRAAGLDMNKPIANYSEDELELLLYSDPVKVQFEGANLTYEGIIPRVRKSMLAKDREAMQAHIRKFVDRAIVFAPCKACDGTRLNDTARSVTIDGVNIGEVASWQADAALDWVKQLAIPGAESLLATLRHLLQGFVDIGLGYLGLDRPSGSLSGGEAQRVKMIRQLGSPLTDVTYVFDEPTAGLHPADIQRLTDLLLQLRDAGNSLDHRSGLKDTFRTPTGQLALEHISQHNLHDVSVTIPIGVLTTVTGVAGSGKSTLLAAGLAERDDVVVIDPRVETLQPGNLYRSPRCHPQGIRQNPRGETRTVFGQLRRRLPRV